MIQGLKAVWMERTERERAVIALCSALTALALAYAYAWLPVTRERDRLLVRVPELRAEAQAMERDARELKRLKGSATPPVGLKSAIERATASSPLAAAAPDIVQQDSTKVRVAIASARADQAFGWLARLQSVPGVRLESIRLTSLGDDNRVKIEAMAVSTR